MVLGAGRDLRRDHDQQEHDQQGRQPVLAAVGVEAIGVDRVARPDPPQRQEQQHELQHLLRRDVAAVRLAQDLLASRRATTKIRSKNSSSQVARRCGSKYRRSFTGPS
jgi:hypothetical protein